MKFLGLGIEMHQRREILANCRISVSGCVGFLSGVLMLRVPQSKRRKQLDMLSCFELTARIKIFDRIGPAPSGFCSNKNLHPFFQR